MDDVFRSNKLFCDIGYFRNHRRIIDQRISVALIGKLYGSSVHGSGGLGDLLDPFCSVFTASRIKGPYGAVKLSGVRNYVIGCAGLHHADSHDYRIQRGGASGDYGLQSHHDLGGDVESVYAQIRSGGMGTLSMDDDPEMITAGIDGPGRQGYLS